MTAYLTLIIFTIGLPITHGELTNIVTNIVSAWTLGRNCEQQFNWSVSNAFSSYWTRVFMEDVPLDIRRIIWYQHDGGPAHYHTNARQLLDAWSVPKQVDSTQWPRRVACSVTRHDAIRFLLVGRDECIGVRETRGLWRRSCCANSCCCCWPYCWNT